jgi:leader peptidase (prepilin peptidase) / N-methyltransferase
VEIIAGLAGALAGVPATAVGYAVPAEGAVRLSGRWWIGATAPRLAVLAMAPVAGASSALVAAKIATPAVLPAFWLVAVLGTALAVADIRRQRLPHALVGVLWAACASGFTAYAIIEQDLGRMVRAGIGAAAIAGLLLVLALALPGQLGLGDVNLAGVLAFSLAWLGLRSLITGLAAGLILQAIVGLVAITLGRAARHKIAMGPALLVGWLLAISVVPT